METNAALWLLGPAGMCASLVKGHQRQIAVRSKVAASVYPNRVGAEAVGAFAH